ncbi:MAG: L-2-hydroxyglutarate oxidase [Bacteroidetes bacterium]|nr:MAG: L-2-hydroxyglutarate oxidase [Bacteroidota bacterium]
MKTDIAIVGGGIIGCAVAYKMSLYFPNKKIILIEKEDALAKHQTGRNSGVIHSGIYYKPGSYKAVNCVKGRRELVAFAREYNIPHDVCGKIIVATDEKELPYLNKVFQNGLANGVEGIEMIDSKRIKEIEPYCEGIQAIYVPCTGIIDFPAAARKMAELMKSKNPQNDILLNTEVTHLNQKGESVTIITTKGEIHADYVIVCGGLQADRLAGKKVTKNKVAIVGFRGDYYDLTPEAQYKVRNLIYPVPNPQFPFLGVHFTRMIHGGIECGPNAVFVFKREGYSKTAFSWKDTLEAFGFKGTWKFFFKHWKFGIDEYRGAFSKRFFLKRLQKLIPSLKMDEIVPSRCGIRAMALDENGNMLDDFKMEADGRVLHVINSPSPAATASLAYGEEIVKTAIKELKIIS